MDMILFLFNQYKLGVVEGRGEEFTEHCLVNVGYCQGSRLSCNGYNGIQDAVIRKTFLILWKSM